MLPASTVTLTTGKRKVSPVTDIQILYDGPIVKRADAKAQGLKRYFTGKPCGRNHIDERRTTNGECVECTLVKVKEWRERNPEYNKEYMKVYKEKNPDYWNDWYQENIEYKRGKSKEWAENNKDRKKDNWREWYDANQDYCRERNSKWRRENPEKARILDSNNKARRRGAEGSYSECDIKEILERQRNKCAEPTCSKDLSNGYHVYHIMPIVLGGSNWPENLQCLCQRCNNRKHAKHPIDWAIENGRLC